MTHCSVMALTGNGCSEKRRLATRGRVSLCNALTVGLAALSLLGGLARAEVDLLKKYPTSLKTGDTAPDRARAWQFTPEDIFHLSGFTNTLATTLLVQVGVSDLGLAWGWAAAPMGLFGR
jgi:hypothetical protein